MTQTPFPLMILTAGTWTDGLNSEDSLVGHEVSSEGV
jgi:hypothetical protein